jgi:two-component system, NtrC family, response regulator HydG
MATILIVDDEQNTRDALDMILRREEHEVIAVGSGESALAHLNTHEVDLVLSDVKMPGIDGLTLLRRVKAYDAGIVVVMMSGYGDITVAVEAMKEGAFDYLVKPCKKDDVLRTVAKALKMRAVLVENGVLKRQIQDQFDRAQVIGSSSAWRQVCDMVEQVAPSRATVLITGESGTGKEKIASLVHRFSPRAEQPFVTLNAAALPESLLEAELFGYEKGAFTGALQRKSGRFETAAGGTLFIDEIGELPLSAQAKLLRVLQEGTFERLGGTKTRHVDVRIVAATNKNLVEEIDSQRFREDLYYRINVVNIELPPLRERPEDIPLLAAHFLRKYAEQNQKVISAIQQDALRRLQAYAWPGNVRELENVIERAVVLTPTSTVELEHLPPHLQDNDPVPIPSEGFALSLGATLAEIERAAIEQALKRSGGHRQTAARMLDIGSATMYRKLKEYELE